MPRFYHNQTLYSWFEAAIIEHYEALKEDSPTEAAEYRTRVCLNTSSLEEECFELAESMTSLHRNNPFIHSIVNSICACWDGWLENIKEEFSNLDDDEVQVN